MILLKFSFALLLTIILAIIAYFVSQTTVGSASQVYIASIFVLISPFLMLIASKIQQQRTSTNKKVKPARVTQQTEGTISTLYVGNLAYKADEATVQSHFEKFGKVISVRLVKDKRSGRRKGFGFVEIDANDATSFIQKLNESEFMQRNIIVRPANEKQH